MSGSVAPAARTLAECEAVIERSVLEGGLALAEIRDRRLYRSTHGTFEVYCRDRWGWGRWNVNYRIRAADAAASLGDISPKPSGISQAAALLPVAPEERPAAWRRVVETAPDGRPTGAHARAIVAAWPASPTVDATADALDTDGSYRDDVLAEALHDALGRLLALRRNAAALVEHNAPEDVAHLISEEDARAYALAEPALDWLRRAFVAGAEIVTVRRVK